VDWYAVAALCFKVLSPAPRHIELCCVFLFPVHLVTRQCELERLCRKGENDSPIALYHRLGMSRHVCSHCCLDNADHQAELDGRDVNVGLSTTATSARGAKKRFQ